MQHTHNILLSVLLVLGLFSLGSTQNVNADAHTPHLLKGAHRRVCSVSVANDASCHAQVIADKAGTPSVTALPAGYGPAQFHGAYKLPTTSTNPGVIAIVDAYDDPNIASDLANYDKTYSLPTFPNCTTTVKTACFEKVNQTGGTSYPQRNTSWGIEISLDVETAHETCQNCKVILVEANNSSYANLMQAIDRARLLGATVISNSYGSSEMSGESTYDSHFNYPGIAFIFSSGDGGYGATYPASSPFVSAVGGTTLNVTSTNEWQSETVWSGTGSGCSLYEAKPSFQKDSGCLNRTVADVSADADPNTGAAVYDSFGYGGNRGWYQVGGTSLASPIIAGAYALANNISPAVFANSIPYSDKNISADLHDITSGSNGSCGTYLCQASTGYDGPSGLGTPIGLGAF